MIEITKNRNSLQIIVPPMWEDFSIEKILKEVWQLPKKMVHQLRMEKSIEVNGALARFSDLLHAGDVVLIDVSGIENDLEAGPGAELKPTQLDLDILYEDDHLLVVNKPAGAATHPNEPTDRKTVASGLAYYFQQKGIDVVARHVHRLDKDTTGAILFAKHRLAHVLLDRWLTERKIKRTYTAVVHGKLRDECGIINARIGRDRHHPTRRRVSPGGQDAVTHYQVIHYEACKKLSQILCKLDTGRTHQIRVHLSYIGHPLAGDTLYGGMPIFSRQALHAKFLEFEHPLTLEKIRVEAPYLDKEQIFFK